MNRKYPVKLIALSGDPKVRTKRFKEENEPPPIDLNLYSVYRVDGPDIQKIVFGPTPKYRPLNPKSKEYKQVLEEAGNF